MGKVAITGAASLAAVFALAPVAVASTDDAPSTETNEPTESPTPPTESAAEPTEPPVPSEATTPGQPIAPIRPQPKAAPAAPAPAAADEAPEAPAAEVVPDFGEQKYRIGVKVADGSYVPAGTTTVGSTFRITETGPNVFDGQGYPVPSFTFTCTTTSDTVEDDSGTSYCLNPNLRSRRAKVTASAADTTAVVRGGVEVDPNASFVPWNQAFYARPGSTVTVRQLTATPNLLPTPAVATIKPCEDDPDTFNGYCAGNFEQDTKLSLVLFADPGLPPIARDDSETTDPGEPVDIPVLDNDDTVHGAPLTGLVVVSDPSDGTATVSGPVGESPNEEPPAEEPPNEEPPVDDNLVGETSVRPAFARVAVSSTSSRIVVNAAAGSPVITYKPKRGFTGKDTFNYTISTVNGTATATVTVTVRDNSGGSTDDADQEEGVLPEVGGADAQLLGYAAALIAGGGGLVVLGRRRTRDSDALAG